MMTEKRVVTFDVSCSCGRNRTGIWSADDAGDWAESHECYPEEN